MTDRSPVLTSLKALLFVLGLMTSSAATASAARDTQKLIERRAQAEAARTSGDCRLASERYAALAMLDTDVRTARQATQLAMLCAQPGPAWTAAQRWRSLDPENVDALQAFGLVAIEQYRLEAARAVMKELLGKPDVEADQALADLIPATSTAARAQASWAVFNAILNRQDLAPATLIRLAELAVEAYDYGGAKALLQLALERDSGAAAATALLARLAAADGTADLALDLARQAQRLDPQKQRFAVAETLIELDQTEAARQELETLRQDEALADDAGRRLALLALAVGDLEDARRRFAQRLTGSEGGAEALFYLGAVAERSGDLETALGAYQRLAQLGGGLLPRVRAAALELQRGAGTEALKALDEFANSDPRQAIEVASARAEVLADAGRFDAAIESIDASLLRHPQHTTLLYQRAMLLERAGRTSAAIREFEKVLAMRPGDPSVQNALGYTLVDHDRQLKRAETLIRKALEQMPDNAALIDSLAWLLYRRGEPAAAEPMLARAWRLARDAEIAAHWGEVLWKLGREAEARTIWARALAGEPDAPLLKSTIARFTASEPKKK